MISISPKMRTVMNVVNALLWLFLLIANWSENEFLLTIAIFSMALIVFFYFIMGATKHDAIKAPIPLIYPVLALPVIWTIAFIVIFNTRGTFVEPSSFILGMHPSMAGAILIFWVGTMLTTALSYGLFFKHSIDDEEWEEFLKEAHRFKKLN